MLVSLFVCGFDLGLVAVDLAVVVAVMLRWRLICFVVVCAFWASCCFCVLFWFVSSVCASTRGGMSFGVYLCFWLLSLLVLVLWVFDIWLLRFY